MCDHTVLPSTQHKWTRPAYNPQPCRLVPDLPTPEGWKAELTYSWRDSAPAGSRTSNLPITSPTPNRCTTKTTDYSRSYSVQQNDRLKKTHYCVISVAFSGAFCSWATRPTEKVSEGINRNLPARNTPVQLLALYTDSESHNRSYCVAVRSAKKYECTIDQELTDAAEFHSPGSNTFFARNDVMSAILTVWRQIEMRLRQPTRTCLKNVPVRFHPDLIWNVGARFLKRSPQQEQQEE